MIEICNCDILGQANMIKVTKEKGLTVKVVDLS